MQLRRSARCADLRIPRLVGWTGSPISGGYLATSAQPQPDAFPYVIRGARFGVAWQSFARGRQSFQAFRYYRSSSKEHCMTFWRTTPKGGPRGQVGLIAATYHWQPQNCWCRPQAPSAAQATVDADFNHQHFAMPLTDCHRLEEDRQGGPVTTGATPRLVNRDTCQVGRVSLIQLRADRFDHYRDQRHYSVGGECRHQCQDRRSGRGHAHLKLRDGHGCAPGETFLPAAAVRTAGSGR